MLGNSAVYGAIELYLISTHITRTKIIAAVVVGVVLVVGLVVFFVMRRRRSVPEAGR